MSGDQREGHMLAVFTVEGRVHVYMNMAMPFMSGRVCLPNDINVRTCMPTKWHQCRDVCAYQCPRPMPCMLSGYAVGTYQLPLSIVPLCLTVFCSGPYIPTNILCAIDIGYLPMSFVPLTVDAYQCLMCWTVDAYQCLMCWTVDAYQCLMCWTVDAYQCLMGWTVDAYQCPLCWTVDAWQCRLYRTVDDGWWRYVWRSYLVRTRVSTRAWGVVHGHPHEAGSRV